MRQRHLDLVERREIAWTIIAFNFVGFVCGVIFWYGGHLLSTANRWVLWPFIPDCPLFAGLFIIAFLGLRHGRDWRLFYTLTAFGLIKYGVWTVVYTVAYWQGGGLIEPMSLAMGVSHLGMILEGIYVSYRIVAPVTKVAVQEALPPMERWGAVKQRPALSGAEGSGGARETVSTGEFTPAPLPPSTSAQKTGFRQRDVLIAFGWFLLSDFVDYGLGQYPRFDTRLVSLALIQWHTIFMTFALTAAYLALSRQHSAETEKEKIR